MAKQIITKLIDDLDGSEADQSIVFSVDGAEYTVDLNEKNAEKFFELMTPFMNAGQRLGRVPRQRQAPKLPGTAPTAAARIAQAAATVRAISTAPASVNQANILRKEKTGDIRRWAESQGIKLSSRGRIPREIEDRYDREFEVTVKKGSPRRGVAPALFETAKAS